MQSVMKVTMPINGIDTEMNADEARRVWQELDKLFGSDARPIFQHPLPPYSNSNPSITGYPSMIPADYRIFTTGSSSTSFNEPGTND